MEQSKVWIDELKSFEEKDIVTRDIFNSVLRSLDSMKLTMSDSYECVSGEAKELLSALQRTPAGDSRVEKARSRLSDYTDAASHVMDVIVELYEQNKQLNIIWEKQKVRMSQKFRLNLFDQECLKVSKHYFLSA